ncbi:hypothetical protein AB837_00381 [bacterium AB1]|nr:hypothetical protein AB837_00381 [bacterium AB1]
MSQLEQLNDLNTIPELDETAFLELLNTVSIIKNYCKIADFLSQNIKDKVESECIISYLQSLYNLILCFVDLYSDLEDKESLITARDGEEVISKEEGLDLLLTYIFYTVGYTWSLLGYKTFEDYVSRSHIYEKIKISIKQQSFLITLVVSNIPSIIEKHEHEISKEGIKRVICKSFNRFTMYNEVYDLDYKNKDNNIINKINHLITNNKLNYTVKNIDFKNFNNPLKN